MASRTGQAPAYRELFLGEMDFDAVNAVFAASAKTLTCTISSRAHWVVQTIQATSLLSAMAAMPHTIPISNSGCRAA